MDDGSRPNRPDCVSATGFEIFRHWREQRNQRWETQPTRIFIKSNPRQSMETTRAWAVWGPLVERMYIKYDQNSVTGDLSTWNLKVKDFLNHYEISPDRYTTTLIETDELLGSRTLLNSPVEISEDWDWDSSDGDY